MLRLLIDTCVWLDLAKDYRHQPTLHALESLISADAVTLLIPRQVLDEFTRNKERIVHESGRSLSSTFKRVREAVRQFGHEETRDRAIAVMEDVDHRIVILGEAVNDSIARIEGMFATAEIIETTDAVKLRAAQRALDKKAPFHRERNGMGDAILIETFRDSREAGGENVVYGFVSFNKHDFSDMAKDERQAHPDLADLFDGEKSFYSLNLGELLNGYAPEWMEDVKWEFEYQEEPRRLSEIMEACELFLRQIWYNRHMYHRAEIETGDVKLVTKEQMSTSPYRRDETLDTVWVSALAAAKRTEEEVGLENLGPWSDFEWGMLNGKLSALRWVTGSEWDFLDT